MTHLVRPSHGVTFSAPLSMGHPDGSSNTGPYPQPSSRPIKSCVVFSAGLSWRTVEMGHHDGPTRWVMWCRLKSSKSNLYWVTNMLYSDDGTIDSMAWSMLSWISWNCEFAQFVTAVNSPSTCLLHNNPLTVILLLWPVAEAVYTVCFSASDVTCIHYISTVCSLQECTERGHYQWWVLRGRWHVFHSVKPETAKLLCPYLVVPQ